MVFALKAFYGLVLSRIALYGLWENRKNERRKVFIYKDNILLQNLFKLFSNFQKGISKRFQIF